jgi:CRISPR-associated protein Csb1
MGLYERIESAVELAGDDAALTISATFMPVGGMSAKVFPPTFPVAQTAPDRQELSTPYVVEPRLVDGEPTQTVLLDSVQSQANGVESALERAVKAGRLALPYLLVEHELSTGRKVSVSSLSAPHRFADAYFRDSKLNGVPFDRTDVGKRLRSASAEDCTPLYEREPLSALLGAWDSQRKGRQARFARLYRSEIFGVEPEFGRRAAGRMDPHNLIGAVASPEKATDGSVEWDHVVPADKAKVKGQRLSEIGHGNVAPQPAHGGATVRSVRRLASISMAGVARLRFGDASPEAARAARVALVALGLVGDRLAFGAPGLWLRSGCELVLVDETIGWQKRGGGVDPIEVTTAEAIDLFERAREAAAAEGLVMASDVVRLTPGTGLAKAWEHSYLSAQAEDAS